MGKNAALLRCVRLPMWPRLAVRNVARTRGKAQNACPKGFIRDGWHLMLTNLTAAQAGVSQLAAVYPAHWAE